MDELKDQFSSFFKQYKIPLFIGGLGLLLFGYGLTSSFAGKSKKDDIVFTSAKDAQVPAKAVKVARDEQTIVVDIAGAVEKPGLYHLKEESRVGDSIDAAGGLNESADTEKIAKSMNLAAKLSDGSKIYIPRIGESTIPLRQGFAGQASITGENTTTDGRVNINTSTESELDSLPGIGPVTATKVINGRPYGAVEELLSKKVVSKSVYEKIKEKVGVY